MNGWINQRQAEQLVPIQTGQAGWWLLHWRVSIGFTFFLLSFDFWQARQEHLKSFAGKSWSKYAANCNGTATEDASVEVLGDAMSGYIVNVAREEDEDPVRIPPSISAKLKPHQVSCFIIII